MGLYLRAGPAAVVAHLEHKNLVSDIGGSRVDRGLDIQVYAGRSRLNTECGAHVAERYRRLARFLLGDCKPVIGHSYAPKLRVRLCAQTDGTVRHLNRMELIRAS